jgi:hypothetical protein
LPVMVFSIKTRGVDVGLDTQNPYRVGKRRRMFAAYKIIFR